MNNQQPPKKYSNVAVALIFAIAVFVFLLTVLPVFRAFVSGFIGGMGG